MDGTGDWSPDTSDTRRDPKRSSEATGGKISRAGSDEGSKGEQYDGHTSRQIDAMFRSLSAWANVDLVAVGMTVVMYLLLLAGAMAYAVRLHGRTRKQEDVKEVAALDASDDTMFPLLQGHLVPMNVVEERGYSSVLSLVQVMIGTRPTCDMALEIWPPAFRAYNIIVPNFLNIPHMILGVPGAVDVGLVSLAMYASSRASQCAYCTSHCCSFAARRGVDPAVLQALLDNDNKVLTSTQRAVTKVAYGLGTVPSTLTADDASELKGVMSTGDIEWIVAAAAMFGSFNKLMDGLGIPLEPDTLAETKPLMEMPNSKVPLATDNSGWSRPTMDDWTTKLFVVYQGLRPGGALALDAKLLHGIPASKSACMDWLEAEVGDSFQDCLGPLKHLRVVRAVTGVIRENMCETAGLGIDVKLHVVVQFCDILQNPRLKASLQTIRTARDKADRAASADNDELSALILRVAKALSYSPSRMRPSLVEQMRAKSNVLTPPMLVELVSFLATIQMMHRIEIFNHIVKQTK